MYGKVFLGLENDFLGVIIVNSTVLFDLLSILFPEFIKVKEVIG